MGPITALALPMLSYQGMEEKGTDPAGDNGGDSPGDVCDASEDERD